MNIQKNKILKGSLVAMILKGVHFLFEKFIKPKSKNEDLARREFILNILLSGTLFLSVIMLLFGFYRSIIEGVDRSSRGFSTIFLFIFLLIHLILYLVSKKGYFMTASYIFIGLYFIAVTYMIFHWGAELPSGWLFYFVIISISGILISSRFAFIMTSLSSLFIVGLYYLQISKIIIPDLYWKNETLTMPEILILPVVFGIVAVISWLSNREIERSLKRARKSESELKYERDNLEIRMVERTRELRESQMEQMGQLYRFAEFGKLSSGLFHDLMNRLTPVSLNVEQAQMNRGDLDMTKESLSKAIDSAHQMQDFIVNAKKQMTQVEYRTDFFLDKEIEGVIEIMNYKARKSGVKINFSIKENIIINNDPIKFNQVVANLIGNAIDSYNGIDKDDKIVEVGIRDNGEFAILSVEDHGRGINPENIKFIFEPFFSTKEYKKGTGIGLAITKEIIEKNFDGCIDVESAINKGTKFTVKISKKNNEKKLC